MPNERVADVLRKSSEIMRLNAEIQRPYREAQLAKRRERNARIVRDAATRERYNRKRSQDIANGRRDVAPEVLAEADRICAEWLAELDWRCGYCGKPAERANRCADHVRPLSQGGKHEPGNLKRACRSCNSRKGKQSVWFA